MSNEIKNRIVELIHALELNENQFSKKLGHKTNTTIRSIRVGRQKPGYDTIVEILKTFNVNPAWLMLGKGEMFDSKMVDLNPLQKHKQKNSNVDLSVYPSVYPNDKKGNLMGNLIDKEQQIPGKGNIILVEQKAAAGYTQGVRDQEYIEQMPAFNLPGFTNATFRAFEVEGASMEPTIWQGDWLVCQIVESFDHVREGYVHVVVTNDGDIVAKRASYKGKELTLKSDNKAFPPYKLQAGEIREVWRATAKITRYMPSPSNMDMRVADLELTVNNLTKAVETLVRVGQKNLSKSRTEEMGK